MAPIKKKKNIASNYSRGADKSLARPWKETSYSDQDLQHYNRLMVYKEQEYIPVVCMPQVWHSAISLGRFSLFPSRVALRTYQHPWYSKAFFLDCLILEDGGTTIL